jgi:hypothetical protein
MHRMIYALHDRCVFIKVLGFHFLFNSTDCLKVGPMKIHLYKWCSAILDLREGTRLGTAKK